MIEEDILGCLFLLLGNRKDLIMDEKFSTDVFSKYLLQLLQERQKMPMTEFNQGAIATLIEVEETLNMMLKNNEEHENDLNEVEG